MKLRKVKNKITKLSKRASKLNVRMSREEVFNLLGWPTWVVMSGDEGKLALPDPGIELELYWKNPGWRPVVVQFDESYEVTGWDEGRTYCGDDVRLFEPSDEYLCSKVDPAEYYE